MPGHHQRRRSIVRLVLAATLGALLLGGSATLPGATASALSRWSGGIDLYRSGVFTTQKTWLWCTAADVQIIRNIARHQTDHTSANQSRYFSYMRAHDRYAIPVSDGTDPGGWAAGLRHYVDSRYRVVASTSFSAALRSAVTNLRRTNLPVAIAVDHGNHGWVLTGFTATADPARTASFTVTSVRVVGPLWGLQSRTYGYDMRPDTRLTPSQFRSFFTPWHYGRVRMAWEGDWVSIQPIASSSSSTAKATPQPKAEVRVAAATAAPHRTPEPTSQATPSATAEIEPTPATTARPVALGGGPVGAGRPPAPAAPAPASAQSGWDPWTIAGLAMAAVLALGAALLGGRGRQVRSATRRARRV
ncbi:MAG TPA: hypothetical protein VGQ31_02180 [Candidatus Limnocylindrales bacterium]|nr:hypothetical protein [Candidatus Limnocylindrales bacterium]